VAHALTWPATQFFQEFFPFIAKLYSQKAAFCTNSTPMAAWPHPGIPGCEGQPQCLSRKIPLPGNCGPVAAFCPLSRPDFIKLFYCPLWKKAADLCASTYPETGLPRLLTSTFWEDAGGFRASQ
jgi:hypothetical protein